MIIFDVPDVLTSLIIGKLLLDFSLDCVSLMNYTCSLLESYNTTERLWQMESSTMYNKQEESSWDSLFI